MQWSHQMRIPLTAFQSCCIRTATCQVLQVCVHCTYIVCLNIHIAFCDPDCRMACFDLHAWQYCCTCLVNLARPYPAVLCLPEPFKQRNDVSLLLPGKRVSLARQTPARRSFLPLGGCSAAYCEMGRPCTYSQLRTIQLSPTCNVRSTM